ncbi:ABC transporter substrate-binding protein [Candidatus Poriferisocius sp.]|uniref:taurine ABC transporter substrate-binding protein n=1 Tax=Candidatus Poriferisocius sp. TaxID=3101276 RepID=UPI003B5B1D27
MKRLLALLMVLGLVAAACGNDDDSGGADAPPDDDTPTTTEPDDGGDAGDGAAGDGGGSAALDELNVAYFLEWPTANQVAQAEQTYDEALGLTVNWIPFASGGDMAQAMESGDIDISYSQGLTPFANFVNSGSDLLLVGVAVSYADADNCVANPDMGITAENAAETLAGQSIYTPLGNVTHFKLLKMLEHLGVDTSTVELIQSEGGPAAVAALDSGQVAMACAFGGAVNQMIANGGNLVMTGSEQEAIGIRVFDIISTTGTFAAEHPDVVTGFLQVTEDANAAYNDNRGPFIDTIAEAAGMDRESTIALLDAFSFPERDVQLSEDWLGGTVQQVMKDQMDFFVAQGEIPSALASYEPFVDTSFLEAVQGRTGGSAGGDEMALDELNVAYFLEWPTANQVAQAEQTYDEALGLTVNWIPFASGGDMAQAMESGDIDISYSQGLTPFANFVNSGSDLLLVGVAVSYADADNCVANPDMGITAENAAETLAGQSIYTPLGNVTHFKLLKMLEHLGVDTSTVELIQSEGGPAAVAALDSGQVAMACAFGGAVNQMIANGGNLVMTGSEQEAIGIRVFDIISTTGDFAQDHPSIVTGFLQVTEDANRAYNADRGPFIDTIAEAAGMDRESTIALLDAFSFPERDVQLSEDWLGGTVQQVMKDQMDFFVAQGEIPSALASYEPFVDTSFLEAVN